MPSFWTHECALHVRLPDLLGTTRLRSRETMSNWWTTVRRTQLRTHVAAAIVQRIGEYSQSFAKLSIIEDCRKYSHLGIEYPTQTKRQ
jgi:hypothetical protein